MKKCKEFKELLDKLNTKDLPEGETLVYMGEDFIDILSNTNNLEEVGSTVDGLLQTVAAIVMRVLENAPEDESVKEIVEEFLEMFRSIIYGQVSKDSELFNRFITETNSEIQDLTEENEDLALKIKTESYN